MERTDDWWDTFHKGPYDRRVGRPEGLYDVEEDLEERHGILWPPRGRLRDIIREYQQQDEDSRTWGEE